MLSKHATSRMCGVDSLRGMMAFRPLYERCDNYNSDCICFNSSAIDCFFFDTSISDCRSNSILLICIRH